MKLFFKQSLSLKYVIYNFILCCSSATRLVSAHANALCFYWIKFKIEVIKILKFLG